MCCVNDKDRCWLPINVADQDPTVMVPFVKDMKIAEKLKEIKEGPRACNR